MAAENMTGNLPNTVNGVYQRPLPRDFEDALSGSVCWKNELGNLDWDKMPVLPAGIFTSFDTSLTATDGAIYIGNGDTSSVQAEWGVDVAQYDWLRYYADTSSYGFITPTKGQLCFDTSANVWNTYDTSTTGWLEMQTVISSGNSYTTKTVDIGDWNMDATTTLNVAHGLSVTEWKTVRNMFAMIRDDSDSNLYNLSCLSGTSFPSDVNGSITYVDSTNIFLARSVSGDFDNTNFDKSTTTSPEFAYYNRGWITFEYIKD